MVVLEEEQPSPSEKHIRGGSMNLVVGATGLLGSEICHQLTEKGKSVRALVRPTANKQKVEELRSLGIKLLPGDLRDLASLRTACRHAKSVVSTASAAMSRQPGDTIKTVDLEGQLNLIHAAQEAEVQHFVYISFSGNSNVDCQLLNAKRLIEIRLIESGLAYTILRAAPFMEIWFSPALGFDVDNGRAQIFGSGEQKISYISHKDVARFAVESLDNPDARNTTIELGGPQALTPLEAVKEFEQLGNRRFVVEHVPESALVLQKSSSRDPIQESLVALMLQAAHGDSVGMESTLRRFSIPLTSVKDYAKQRLH